MILRLLPLFVVGATLTPKAQELYRAQDQNGSTIYTDNAGKIPQNATVYPLEPDTQAGQTANTQNNAHFFTPFLLDESGHLLVEVELIHGAQVVKTKLVYDTGAPYVHLHRRIAQALHLKPLDIMTNQLSDGSNQKTTSLAIAQLTLKLGALKLMQTPVIWNTDSDYFGPPWDFDGMLGMNVIRQFDTRIDYDKKQIEWRRRQTK